MFVPQSGKNISRMDKLDFCQYRRSISNKRKNSMLAEIHTLQDFVLITEGWIYIIMGISLVLFLWFYGVLIDRDEKDDELN